MSFKLLCNKLSHKITEVTGSWYAGLLSIFVVVSWIVGGLFLGYTDTYQILLGTITNIVTLIMLFFIQNAQNRESKALHIKLDELILNEKKADNALIQSETLNEEEINTLQEKYIQLAEELRNSKEDITKAVI